MSQSQNNMVTNGGSAAALKLSLDSVDTEGYKKFEQKVKKYVVTAARKAKASPAEVGGLQVLVMRGSGMMVIDYKKKPELYEKALKKLNIGNNAADLFTKVKVKKQPKMAELSAESENDSGSDEEQSNQMLRDNGHVSGDDEGEEERSSEGEYESSFEFQDGSDSLNTTQPEDEKQPLVVLRDSNGCTSLAPSSVVLILEEVWEALKVGLGALVYLLEKVGQWDVPRALKEIASHVAKSRQQDGDLLQLFKDYVSMEHKDGDTVAQTVARVQEFERKIRDLGAAAGKRHPPLAELTSLGRGAMFQAVLRSCFRNNAQMVSEIDTARAIVAGQSTTGKKGDDFTVERNTELGSYLIRQFPQKISGGAKKVPGGEVPAVRHVHQDNAAKIRQIREAKTLEGMQRMSGQPCFAEADDGHCPKSDCLYSHDGGDSIWATRAHHAPHVSNACSHGIPPLHRHGTHTLLVSDTSNVRVIRRVSRG